MTDDRVADTSDYPRPHELRWDGESHLWHLDHPFDSNRECCQIEVGCLMRGQVADQHAIDTLLEALEKAKKGCECRHPYDAHADGGLCLEKNCDCPGWQVAGR